MYEIRSFLYFEMAEEIPKGSTEKRGPHIIPPTSNSKMNKLSGHGIEQHMLRNAKKNIVNETSLRFWTRERALSVSSVSVRKEVER